MPVPQPAPDTVPTSMYWNSSLLRLDRTAVPIMISFVVPGAQIHRVLPRIDLLAVVHLVDREIEPVRVPWLCRLRFPFATPDS